MADVNGPDPGAHRQHAGAGEVSAEEQEAAGEGHAAHLHHDQQLLPTPRRLQLRLLHAEHHGSFRRRHRKLVLRQQEKPGPGQKNAHTSATGKMIIIVEISQR